MFSKCPVCGYEEKDNKSTLIPIRGDKATNSIKELIKRLKSLKLATDKDISTFLIRIRDANDLIVINMIDRYFRQGHYIEKGLHYLAAMINNADNQSETRKEIEEKLYGKKPIYRNVKK